MLPGARSQFHPRLPHTDRVKKPVRYASLTHPTKTLGLTDLIKS